jgi:hypothetical protein
MSKLLIRLFIVSVLSLISCGYNPDTSSYDTVANSDKYPARALRLIEGIESGRLADYDSIIAAFGDLYSNNAELLDDGRWLKVIERLGAKFRFRAEQLVGQGMRSYLQAARYFTLACLARPQDDRLRSRHLLFATWEKAIADSVVPADFDPQKSQLDLKGRLALLKYFELGDSNHRQFAADYILPQIFAGRSLQKAFNSSVTRDLSAADKCFLDIMDVRHESFESVVGAFTEPRIDLVAAQIVRQRGDWYAAELYFRPLDSITTDYTVALELPNPASSDSSRSDSQLLALDFHPEIPTTRWRPGSIASAYRWFRYGGSLKSVAVGLYERQGDSTAYVRVAESGEPLLALPSSVLVTK